MSLLHLLAAPVSGTLWVVKQVVREAERRYYDPQAIVAELGALEREREHNRITAAEYETQAAVLTQRLEPALARRHHG